MKIRAFGWLVTITAERVLFRHPATWSRTEKARLAREVDEGIKHEPFLPRVKKLRQRFQTPEGEFALGLKECVDLARDLWEEGGRGGVRES